jgi:hypothetical protein
MECDHRRAVEQRIHRRQTSRFQPAGSDVHECHDLISLIEPQSSNVNEYATAAYLACATKSKWHTPSTHALNALVAGDASPG